MSNKGYKRPEVLEAVHVKARAEAVKRHTEFRGFLSSIILLGIEALEEQEQAESRAKSRSHPDPASAN